MFVVVGGGLEGHGLAAAVQDLVDDLTGVRRGVSSQSRVGLPGAGATPPRTFSTQASVRPLVEAKLAMVSSAQV